MMWRDSHMEHVETDSRVDSDSKENDVPGSGIRILYPRASPKFTGMVLAHSWLPSQ